MGPCTSGCCRSLRLKPESHEVRVSTVFDDSLPNDTTAAPYGAKVVRMAKMLPVSTHFFKWVGVGGNFALLPSSSPPAPSQGPIPQTPAVCNVPHHYRRASSIGLPPRGFLLPTLFCSYRYPAPRRPATTWCVPISTPFLPPQPGPWCATIVQWIDWSLNHAHKFECTV